MPEGGRFEILGTLGKGGMGTVFRARDRESGAIVAIKELHPMFLDDAGYIARFEREVEVARRINSPNTVRVLGYGKRGGNPYMVMEYVEGQSLRDLLNQRQRLSWEEAKPILMQVAEGLRAAHLVGVIHRDVKPSNILLAPDGTVKLADFGIARASDLTRLTGGATMLGTPAYMAPENTPSPQADLYGLGCVLYEMLAGHAPFTGESQQEVMLKHMRERPDLTEIPLPARKTVTALLQKSPQRRPASATALLVALESDATGAPTPAGPPTPQPPRVSTTRVVRQRDPTAPVGAPAATRYFAFAGGAGVVVLIVVLLLLKPWDGGGDEPVSPDTPTAAVADETTETPTPESTAPGPVTATPPAPVTPTRPPTQPPTQPPPVSRGPTVTSKDWSTANARWGDTVQMRVNYQNGDAPLAKLQLHEAGVTREGTAITWAYFNWEGTSYQWSSDNYMVVPLVGDPNERSYIDMHFDCVRPMVAASRMFITLIDTRGRRSQEDLSINFICSQTGN